MLNLQQAGTAHWRNAWSYSGWQDEDIISSWRLHQTCDGTPVSGLVKTDFNVTDSQRWATQQPDTVTEPE